jgi:hypothetical protein
MNIRRIFLFVLLLGLVPSFAVAQTRNSSFFGWQLLESEIMKSESSLWMRQSCYAEQIPHDSARCKTPKCTECARLAEVKADVKYKAGDRYFDNRKEAERYAEDNDLHHVYTCVGSEKDYTPHYPARVPGWRTYASIFVSLNYVPLANGDGKFDEKAYNKALDSYLSRQGLDKKSAMAQRLRDAFKEGGISNFILFARVNGIAGDREIELTWTGSGFEGLIDVTDFPIDKYQWELTFGFRDMRERIKLSLPIVSIFWKPTVNRPSSQYNEQTYGSEFAICPGDYFTGINHPNELWKLTVYTRRATFESHQGTSWSKADTSGGYLSAVAIPPSFVPGQVLDSSYVQPQNTLPSQRLLDLVTPPGGGGTTPLKPEIKPHVTPPQGGNDPTVLVTGERTQHKGLQAFRIVACETYSVTFRTTSGKELELAKDFPPTKFATLFLDDFRPGEVIVIKVGNTTKTWRVEDILKAPLGTKLEQKR